MTETMAERTSLGQACTRAEVDVTYLVDALADSSPVTVVITVYNGGESVERCLRSVLTHTPGVRILVIDDASTDSAVIEMLDSYRRRGLVDLVRHGENLGYTRTINHALELTAGEDIVLLNSDTVVGPLWLQRLRWVAYSRPVVASVTAASSNAGAMSLPKPGAANVWAPHLSWTEIARLVAQHTETWAQSMPTANGFCVYLRREAIDSVGGFDADAFPRGYGEENDWSMRAIDRGFVNLYAPHVFIDHVRSQSFGSARKELVAAGRKAVDVRHPSYTDEVRAWRASPASRTIEKQSAAIQRSASASEGVGPRRLYVLHRAGGGTPATNLDLIESLRAEQASFLLESLGGRSMELSSVVDGKAETLRRWTPPRPFTVHDRWDAAYARFVAEVLVELNIELIHVRHLIHTPITTLPEVARRLGIRLIYSTHDFHPVCPTIQLLDENLTYCGGTCTPGSGNCTLPASTARLSPESLKNGWVHEWRTSMAGVMDSADTVIATTPSAAGVIRDNFPRVGDKLRIIEHGRDVGAFRPARPSRRAAGPLRILAPANWAPQKGTDFVRSVANLVGDEVEWHFLGKGSERFLDVGAVHGEYTRETLVRLTKAIDPDFVGLFSIWPETYSHTLTEAWAMGIPVLATDLGAFRDRITRLGGGHLLSLDAKAAARVISSYAADPDAVAALRQEVPTHMVRHPQTMANEYARLYAGTQLDLPQLGIVDRFGHGRVPAPAQVRAFRRAINARAEQLVRFERVSAHDYAHGLTGGRFDALLVVGDALKEENADSFLVRAEAEGVRVVLDLDEDLTSPEAVERLTGQGRDTSELHVVRDVASRVDHVLTSTQPLADLVSTLNCSVSVVEDALDPRLWRRPLSARPARGRGELRLLYTGSGTHGGDLKILDGVLARVSRELGRRVVLEVVGSTTDEAVPHTRRIVPPRQDYPRFVTWLRRSAPRWHAGVAPLADTEFNRRESDLKLVEYAALGLPAVASRVGPYIVSDSSARLVDNSVESWVSALVEVLSSDQETTRAWTDQAHERVMTERVLDRAASLEWCARVLGT